MGEIDRDRERAGYRKHEAPFFAIFFASCSFDERSDHPASIAVTIRATKAPPPMVALVTLMMTLMISQLKTEQERRGKSEFSSHKGEQCAKSSLLSLFTRSPSLVR